MYEIYTSPSYVRRSLLLFSLAAALFTAAAVCACVFLHGIVRWGVFACTLLLALAFATLAVSAALHRCSWLLCRADEEEMVFAALRVPAPDVKSLRIWAHIPSSQRLHKRENPQDMLRRLVAMPPLAQLEGTFQLSLANRTLRYTVCNAMETAAALAALGYPVELQLQCGAYVLSYPVKPEDTVS